MPHYLDLCGTATLASANSEPVYEKRACSEAQLVKQCTEVIQLLNAHDFSNPWFAQYVAPDVRIDLQTHVTIGLDGFVGNYRHDASKCASFKVVIGNVTALVDEKQGTGTTILTQCLSGYGSDERQMAGTILMSWTKKQDRWICQSGSMMLGTPVFLTNDVFNPA